MINRLIDMQPMVKKVENKPKVNASITEYAVAFIEGMSDTQLNRFKKMLENGIQCGMSVARSYNIDYDKFINEVKRILKVGV